MHLMRSIPTSPTTTRQEYDVYKLNTPHATMEAHERMTKFYRKVVDEDFELCEKVQRNLERGVFEMGPLHPFHEEGVKAFQGMLIQILREHVACESLAGHEIWAAKPRGQQRIAKNNALLLDHEENLQEGSDGHVQVDGTSLCAKILGCDATRLRNVEW